MSALRQLTGLLLAVLVLVGCKPTDELEACNVARAECQQSIYYALLRLRGDGYDPFLGVPPIRTLTVEEYEAELRGNRPPPPDEPDEPMEPMEPPPVDPWDAALRMLKLVKPSTSSGEARVRDRVNHVAAFYSSATRSVTVIDRGGERNDRADTILLLHELVHAVQDDEIAGWNGATTDADFAARSMIEGEATLYENLGVLELDGRDPDEADWDEFYGNWIDRRRSQMPGQASPFYAVGWFVYPLGGERLTDAYSRGGNAAVRHMQAEWPMRSVAYIAGHDGEETPAFDAIGCAAQRPAKRFAQVGRDRFGAVQVYGFLTVNGLPEEEAWTHARGLSDDQLDLFFDDEAQEVGVSWRLRMSRARDAEALAVALAGAETFVAEATGRDVLVRGTTPTELLPDWPADDDDCD